MLMSLREAAREVNVPYISVQRYHNQGKLPVQRIGRICAIEPNVLKAVLNALGYTPRPKK